MNMNLYTRFERAFKKAYLIPLTFLRYGSTRPHRARLYGCDNWIYIDPNDPRAIKKVVYEPLRGIVSDNLIFWREFYAHLRPELVVDVGVNYGECLFGMNYHPEASIWGFEANPQLITLLDQSRQHHPNGAQINIINCLVSDALTDNVPFFVNPLWSGQSSAIPEINAESQVVEFKLTARPLDSLIPASASEGRTMLFKMDVEGYESRAMDGFVGTLDIVKHAIGFIEFTPRFMRWARVGPKNFFDWLQTRFDIHCFANVKRRKLLRVRNYTEFPTRFGREFTGTDLLLVSKSSTAGWLPPGWEVKG